MPTEEKAHVLKLFSDVQETEVEWLWYPYIPVGKITVLQGYPGDGKSTLMLNLAASLSSGRLLPDRKARSPVKVIYQCAEDGTGDTIKPRLIAAGARCNNIAFLDEDSGSFSIDDNAFRDAIKEFSPKLLVIDPLQAYVGKSDICNTSVMRRMMMCLNMWANQFECAIVLISHFSKRNPSKQIYHGLGTIDVVAQARSVLQIEVNSDDPSIRIMHQVKNSLGPPGEDIAFTINDHDSIDWISIGEVYKGKEQKEELPDAEEMNKQEQTAVILKELLKDAPVRATEVRQVCFEHNICERTMMKVKKILGIKSVRNNKEWFWLME